jgi:hypothetical protein
MKRWIGFTVGILIPGLVIAQTWPSKPIRADVKATLVAQGLEVAPGSPEQFAAHIRSEIARFTQIAKAAGIKAE